MANLCRGWHLSRWESRAALLAPLVALNNAFVRSREGCRKVVQCKLTSKADICSVCGLEAVSRGWCSGRGKSESLDVVAFLHGQQRGMGTVIALLYRYEGVSCRRGRTSFAFVENVLTRDQLQNPVYAGLFRVSVRPFLWKGVWGEGAL